MTSVQLLTEFVSFSSQLYISTDSAPARSQYEPKSKYRVILIILYYKNRINKTDQYKVVMYKAPLFVQACE